MTVGDYAAGNPELASFVVTLSAAQMLEDASNSSESHTILAPTNAAFAAVADMIAVLKGQELWPVRCSSEQRCCCWGGSSGLGPET